MELNYIFLPIPRKFTSVSIEEAILLRRSIRKFKRESIDIDQLSMILWAAYGITDTRRGFRASPSAGAAYPLEVYVVVGERAVVDGKGGYVEAGVYKYIVDLHALKQIRRGDFRDMLARAALDQEWVREAPIDIVVTAVFERTTMFYGERGRVRYVPMDVGHLGQNIYLMTTALGLGTVAIGAFIDDRVAEIVTENRYEIPIYIMPVGKPAEILKTSFEDIKKYILSKRKKIET
jgi:SagB-type dehydrogenase family enzyme